MRPGHGFALLPVVGVQNDREHDGLSSVVVGKENNQTWVYLDQGGAELIVAEAERRLSALAAASTASPRSA